MFNICFELKSELFRDSKFEEEIADVSENNWTSRHIQQTAGHMHYSQHRPRNFIVTRHIFTPKASSLRRFSAFFHPTAVMSADQSAFSARRWHRHRAQASDEQHFANRDPPAMPRASRAVSLASTNMAIGLRSAAAITSVRNARITFSWLLAGCGRDRDGVWLHGSPATVLPVSPRPVPSRPEPGLSPTCRPV